MDKIALVRSLVGLRDEHSSFQNVAGYPMSLALMALSSLAKANRRPWCAT